MIIKFREKDSWVIFGEIDHIVYKQVYSEDDEKVREGESPLYYEAVTGDEQPHKMRLDFFTKNMTEATIVFAYSPIYIMNDNGKTIETI